MKRSVLISVLAAGGVCLFVTVGSAAGYVAKAKSSADVRSGPGKKNAVVDRLNRGEKVKVTKCGFIWCYVTHSGPDGWVAKKSLTKKTRKGGRGNANSGEGSGGSSGGSGGGGGGGNAGNAGGIGNSAPGGMIFRFFQSFFGK